ncbi:MAG: hypothetical protein WA151_05080 [Desulfatirhabdiaceae bacterium]
MNKWIFFSLLYHGAAMKTDSKNKKLVDAFILEKVLTIDVIKKILETSSRMTIFRRLKEEGYYSSYSHCGKYYTLCSIPQFDRNWLWNYAGVHFSRYGSLMETIPVFVKKSEAGCFASDLEKLLHVFVHNALGKLCLSGQLIRKQIGEQYLYLSPVLAESQIIAREKSLTHEIAQSDHLVKGMPPTQPDEPLKTLLSVFDEKQKRLFLGFESFMFGHGGDVRMATAAGVNVKTVARGRKELLSKEIDLGRVRHQGAGRPPLKKTKS